jgi:hypothetical protein
MFVSNDDDDDVDDEYTKLKVVNDLDDLELGNCNKSIHKKEETIINKENNESNSTNIELLNHDNGEEETLINTSVKRKSFFLRSISSKLAIIANDNSAISRQQSVDSFQGEILFDKIRQKFVSFQNKRIAIKAKAFSKILYTGWIAIVGGILLFILVYLLKLNKYLSNDLYVSFVAFSNFITSSGVLLFTTIPIEYCDFDDIVENNRWFRVSVYIFILLLSCVVGIYYMTMYLSNLSI